MQWLGVFPFISGTLSSTNVVLISLLMTWNLSVLRLNHQEASLFLFLLGTVHPVTLLDLSISWKRFSVFGQRGQINNPLRDTNCDLTPKQAEQPVDSNSKHMLDLYELFSFKQLIDRPTRVTLTTSSIIDHTATTRARNIVKSGVYEVSLSDHYMVYCIRKFNGAVEKGHKMIKNLK